MSTAESHPTGMELVVGRDGSISAEELRSLGIQPGTHLRVVEEIGPPRKQLRGILKNEIPPEVVDEITEELRRDKKERIAAIMREDNE